MDESDAVRMCWRRALLTLRRAEAQCQRSPDFPDGKPRPSTRMTAPGSSEETAGKLQTSLRWPASAVSMSACRTIEDGIPEVKATAEDFDRIVDFCRQDFKRKNQGKDMAGNHRAIRRLRTRTLSSSTQETIEILSHSLSTALCEELQMHHVRNSMGHWRSVSSTSAILFFSVVPHEFLSSRR